MILKRHCLLMISCPGDVVRERELLRKCVERINAERADDLWVELKYWMTDTFSDAAMSAQDSINEQIVKDSDGLIAIFNARLGTPVHDYECGTDEEICLMLAANKHVSILFNNKPTIDLTKEGVVDQLGKLMEYRKNREKSYCKTFDSEESFVDLAQREIRLWLRTFSKDVSAEQNDITPEIEGNVEDNQRGTTVNVPELIDRTEIVEAEEPAEDGLLDIIINYTNAADEMNEEIAGYTKDLTSLGEETRAFTDQYKYLANAGKTSTLKAATIQFANKLIGYSNKIDIFNGNIETKWKTFYTNMESFLAFIQKKEDKILMAENIGKLEKTFLETHDSIKGFQSSLEGVPNIQKDFNNARKVLAKSVEETCTILYAAADDCDNLISRYNP